MRGIQSRLALGSRTSAGDSVGGYRGPAPEVLSEQEEGHFGAMCYAETLATRRSAT